MGSAVLAAHPPRKEIEEKRYFKNSITPFRDLTCNINLPLNLAGKTS
jgi:hypothetical protein